MALHLRTARLVIDPVTAADVEAFAAYRSDPDVARWQSWSPDYGVADAQALVAAQPATDLPGPGDWLQLALRDPDREGLYGDVAVHRIAGEPDTFELGVTLARWAQGRGLATEAVTRVLDHLVQHAGAHRVLASCDVRNEAVAALLRRVGMRHESRQVEAEFLKGEWTSVDGYAILGREHRARRPGPQSSSGRR